MVFVVLDCLNMSLIYVSYVALFHDHLYPFKDTNNNELFQQINVIGCQNCTEMSCGAFWGLWQLLSPFTTSTLLNIQTWNRERVWKHSNIFQLSELKCTEKCCRDAAADIGHVKVQQLQYPFPKKQGDDYVWQILKLVVLSTRSWPYKCIDFNPSLRVSGKKNSEQKETYRIWSIFL